MSDKTLPPPPGPLPSGPLPELREDEDGYLRCAQCGLYWEPRHVCQMPQ
jgi:hypothetical protein